MRHTRKKKKTTNSANGIEWSKVLPIQDAEPPAVGGRSWVGLHPPGRGLSARMHLYLGVWLNQTGIHYVTAKRREKHNMCTLSLC